MRAAYRKGTVLGLTIAEIFILLVFLLILTMLVLSSQWNEEKKGYEEILTVLRSSNTDEFITPKQIETLYVRMTEAEQASERYQQALTQEQEHRKEVEETLEQEQERRREAEVALEKSRKEREEAEIAVDVLRRKGENPPCWYETVATGNGKTREKAHYIFNVAVFDAGLVLAPSPVPSGAATDDGGPLTYAEEARWLGVEELPYGKNLGDAAFTKHVKQLVDLGKQSRVRTYSCVFFIRVWDKTSPGAKDRWKQAHDRVLEGMFGTYDVRDEPWPGPR